MPQLLNIVAIFIIQKEKAKAIHIISGKDLKYKGST